ncbi:hypothetical protein Mal48_16820 [Thalassoglobus polymorphus]|uniref:Uncharacterized protein n=1 Tax=Thalassoglobus polymorphus TaxID=2527994 RepID=A0A517QLD2_9PLAN|nr:hypothetical protein Mal48_16820 [Thalassoglobus polymorphus]
MRGILDTIARDCVILANIGFSSGVRLLSTLKSLFLLIAESLQELVHCEFLHNSILNDTKITEAAS